MTETFFFVVVYFRSVFFPNNIGNHKDNSCIIFLYTTILLIFHLSNTLSNYNIRKCSVESNSVKYEINKSTELKHFRRVLFVPTIFVILTDLSSIKTILWGIKNVIPLNWYSLENSLKISQHYFTVFTNEFCAFLQSNSEWLFEY